MRHGIICDNARTGRAVWIDDIYDEPIGEVIAADRSTLSIYILFLISRPEINHQIWVVQCSPQRRLNAVQCSGLINLRDHSSNSQLHQATPNIGKKEHHRYDSYGNTQTS